MSQFCLACHKRDLICYGYGSLGTSCVGVSCLHCIVVDRHSATSSSFLPGVFPDDILLKRSCKCLGGPPKGPPDKQEKGPPTGPPSGSPKGPPSGPPKGPPSGPPKGPPSGPPKGHQKGLPKGPQKGPSNGPPVV